MLVSYRWAAAIVTPNRETREWFPPSPPRAHARHPEPDPRRRRPAGRRTAAAPARLVVSIGRLSEEKGHDRLLEAFARVASTRPGWRLLIAGDGPLRGELEALRDRLGLRERVDLPGLVQDVGRLLGAGRPVRARVAAGGLPDGALRGHGERRARRGDGVPSGGAGDRPRRGRRHRGPGGGRAGPGGRHGPPDGRPGGAAPPRRARRRDRPALRGRPGPGPVGGAAARGRALGRRRGARRAPGRDRTP